MDTATIKCVACGKDASDEVRQAADRRYQELIDQIDQVIQINTAYAASGGPASSPDTRYMEANAETQRQNVLREALSSYVCLLCREKRA
jgi:hypothetical protein